MIFGIDYSYTSPSICVLGDDFRSSYFYFANNNKKVCVKALNYDGTYFEKKLTNIERYEFLANWAIEKIKQHWEQESKIILEGYSYGSQKGLLFNIAENAGLLKYYIKKTFNVFPEIVSPTTVKKLWTGKGNSSKEIMVKTLLDKEGVDIVRWMNMSKLTSPAHDIVDSYAIAKTYVAKIQQLRC